MPLFHFTLLFPLLYAAAVMHVSSTSPDWIVLILGVVLASELGELLARDPVNDTRDRFFELRIAGELGSWRGATVIVLDGLAGVVALQGQGDAGVAPSGAIAFPDDESSSSRGCSGTGSGGRLRP